MAMSLTLELLKEATRLWIDETEAVLVTETTEEINTYVSTMTDIKVMVGITTVVVRDILQTFGIIAAMIVAEIATDARLTLRVAMTTSILGAAGIHLIPLTALLEEAAKQTMQERDFKNYLEERIRIGIQDAHLNVILTLNLKSTASPST